MLKITNYYFKTLFMEKTKLKSIDILKFCS